MRGFVLKLSKATSQVSLVFFFLSRAKLGWACLNVLCAETASFIHARIVEHCFPCAWQLTKQHQHLVDVGPFHPRTPLLLLVFFPVRFLLHLNYYSAKAMALGKCANVISAAIEQVFHRPRPIPYAATLVHALNTAL